MMAVLVPRAWLNVSAFVEELARFSGRALLTFHKRNARGQNVWRARLLAAARSVTEAAPANVRS